MGLHPCVQYKSQSFCVCIGPLVCLAPRDLSDIGLLVCFAPVICYDCLQPFVILVCDMLIPVIFSCFWIICFTLQVYFFYFDVFFFTLTVFFLFFFFYFDL